MTMDPAMTGQDQQCRNRNLFYAIEYGTGQSDIAEETIIDEVKKCLREGADIDAVNYNDDVVLHIAIIRGYKTVIKFLLENGVRVDIENSQGLNALALAQKRKCEQEIIDLLENYEKSITDKSIISYLFNNQPIWSKLRNNSEIAVLVINSVRLSPDFLQQVEFYDAIDTAGNLFFVDVMMSDTANIHENFIKTQLNRLSKQFILQCGSVLNTKVYYKDTEDHVIVIELNSAVQNDDKDSVRQKLSMKDSFCLGLIVKALKLEMVGTFEGERRSLLKVNFESEKQFESLRLIDCAIRYGDVLTVRLLSLSNWNLTKRNEMGSTTLIEAAEYGNKDKLAAVLRLRFPIPHENIVFPFLYYAQMDNLLKTAVKVGNCDIVTFMIRCGVALSKNIIELAWENSKFNVVLLMLKADCVFPHGFDLDKIDASNSCLKELRAFVENRDRLHNHIGDGNLDSLKKLVNSIAPSKTYLNKSNQSALYTAFKCMKIEISTWLKCDLKVTFRDESDERDESEGVSDSIRDALVPYAVQVKNAHILYLVSKSKRLHHQAHFKEFIESIYMELNEIPEVSAVFKVIQFCDQVDIIYDFDSDSIASPENVKGDCDFKIGRIFIKSSVDKQKLLGTIAHELTHLAMQTVYNNECNPYKSDDLKKDDFEEIVEEIEKTSQSVDDIIKRVFTRYKKDIRPSELIVRVNHMLATYGSEEGLSLLDKQAKSLLIYYQDYVMQCCEIFIRESHLSKSRNIVKVLNDYAGIACRIDEENIKLKECVDVREVFHESEVQIAVVTSTIPFLCTMSVSQSLNEISQQPNSFLIFHFDGYTHIKRRSEINKALCFDVCKFLVVLCESDPDEIILRESIEILLDLLKEKPDKKIIFVTENSRIFEEVIIKIEPKFTLKVLPKVEYTLHDVTEESAKLLLDQTVSLQSREVKLSDIINKEHYQLVNAQTLLKLINKQPIVIGKQIITSKGYDENYYIDRMFSYQAVIKEEILKDENKLTMYAISDIDEATLVSLVKKRDSVCTYECLSSGSDRRHIILDSNNGAEQFEQLCQQFPQHNIHWLKKVNGGLYWLKTRGVEGHIKRLQEFVNQRIISNYNEYNFPNDNEMHRVFVVSDTPGMGKSTVLMSLAHRLIKRYPHLWVITIDLNNYSKILDEEQNSKSFEKDDLSGALKCLVNKLLGSRLESRLETEFERNLLLHLIKHNEDRVVIMFDGFDEIKESHQKIITDVLVALKSSKVKQLWVTTRPHMRETLENTLHHLSYTLQPINEEDQVKFLTKFWKRRLNLCVENDVGSVCSCDAKLQCFAEALVKLLSESISDREKVFTGVPLQLGMTAECCEEEVKDFCRSHQYQPHLPRKLELNDIYQKFFHRKYEIFQSEKNSVDFSKLNWGSQNKVLKKDFLDKHRIASLFLHFAEEELALLLTEDEIDRGVSFISDISSCTMNTGIIDLIVEGKPHFVHLTFAEFFIAEFIIELLAKEQPGIELIEFIWTKVFFGYYFKVVRAFINSHLAQTTLTDAVLNEHGRVLRSMWSKKPDIPQLGQFFLGVFRGDKKRHFFPQRRKICDVFLLAAKEGNANLAKALLICIGDHNIRVNLIKCVDDYHWQPLHLAAALGHLDVVKLLVECKANVNEPTCHTGDRFDGFSALFLAAYFGRTDVCEWLIDKVADVNASVNVKGIFIGHNALHLAAQKGQLDVVKMLKNIRGINFNALARGSSAFNSMNALHIATYADHWDVVKWIISEGLIDINVINQHNIGGICPTVLHHAVVSRVPEVVEWLIEHSADVNLPESSHKDTALHLAVDYNRLKEAELLVSNGANVNAVDNIRQSPLHKAVEQGSEQMVELLLTVNNVDVNAVDYLGRTPLHLASMNNYQNIVKILTNFVIKSEN